MRSYHRYTDEQIERVDNTDLVSYAVSQGYEVKSLGNDYKISGLGGMLIKSDRKTWWHGLMDKGGGPIQFVMHIKSKDWADAVSELLRQEPPSLLFRSPLSVSSLPLVLELPEKSAGYRRLFAYLCKTRGVDQKVVYDFVHSRKLYQDTRGNCVFVSYEGDKPVYASLRSTHTGSAFRGDVAGSRKIGWGRGIKSNDSLYVFESPIDLMSYMTIQKQQDKDIDSVNYISLGGVNAAPLTRCLQKNPSIRRVVICTNNDEAGERFYTLNRPKLEAMGIAVLRDRPCGNDWNDDLCNPSAYAEAWEPD